MTKTRIDPRLQRIRAIKGALAAAEMAKAAMIRPNWRPFPGPQTLALESPADIMFYGGAAGGGKTDLELGAATTRHKRSIVFRREKTQLVGIKQRATEIIGPLGRYSGEHGWRLPGGVTLEFGAVAQAGDEIKYQGRPHDLKCFDEIPHFSEAQFRFLIGWNRTDDPNQRCRVIAAGNPPTDAEGDWVIRFWAPWLDKTHPNPAKPGELRWFVVIAGKDIEVADGSLYEHEGELIQPRSRTFIKASVEDNPALMESGYRSVLQAMPEPLRSLMLYGNFDVGQEDHPWQVVPTAWVVAAQKRWVEAEGKPPAGVPMNALGIDVARGGKDKTVMTPRYDNFFGEQHSFPGSATPDGPTLIGMAATILQPGTVINIDVIGVGSSPFDIAKERGIKITALNASEATEGRDKAGNLGFLNCRAEWWWKLREALDPTSGEDLMIPPDREILADLTAPRWKPMARGIQIEAKDDIKARIMRSPDKGESLVYAHAQKYIPGMGLFAYMQAEVDKKRAAQAAAKAGA